MEALQILEREKIDAVISDILMPRMDGYRLCFEVRKHERLQNLPFIMYTANYTSPDDEKLALDLGADKLIRKPASAQILMDVLREVTTEARYRQPRRIHALQEIEVINEYSDRLVSKIEEKNLELTAQTAALNLQGAALNAAANAISITDRNGTIVWVNQAFSTLTGYSAKEAIGENSRNLVNSGVQDQAFYKNMWDTILAGTFWQGEITNRRKDGSLYPEDQTITPVRDDRGEITHFISIRRDITERKAAEARIKSLNRIYAVLSGINAAIVRVRDRQELFNEVCRIAVEHGQFEIAWIGVIDPKTLDIIPTALSTMTGMEVPELFTARASACADLPQGQGETGRAIREKMPVFSNDISVEPGSGGARRKTAIQGGFRSVIALPLQVGGKVVGNLTLLAKEPNLFDAEELKLLTELAGDISFALEYIEKEAKLNYLAYYDVLTGLPSRTLFQDRLDQALTSANRHKGRLAVLLLDLDDFKNINDSLGHNAGDQLLKQFATRLVGGLREGDTVARLGGDEFVAILDNVASEEDASVVTQKILKLGIEPFTIDGHQLFVTCSIGIAFYPKDGEDDETLLKNADAALYRAKDQGRNNAQFCSAEMNGKALQSLTLANDLRHALKQQEFLLHYQPRVNLCSGEITGMEALVRWQHPEQGLVPPGRFIPAAEDSGLIVPLGTWVLHTACAQNKAWQAAGLKPVCVAVNLSARQFRQQDMVELVSRILQETGLDPVYLELELTESMIMHDADATIATLARLKTIGVKLSIDDFGTGYSSLSYLKRFPIDFLKIDQSFVRDLTTDPDDAAITKTIISMAHDLGHKVIAEGVETEAQKSFLHLHHCDEMQGYLFSKPVPAEQVEVLLGKGYL
jgi:diguanylate cyclase (GGDEF)-like protein/PAS domain S-box-containing protein